MPGPYNTATAQQATTKNLGANPEQLIDDQGAPLLYNQDNLVLLPSAAYTTTQTTPDQTNVNGRGLIVVLDMTNVTAGPSVTLEIDGRDPVSGKYYPILTGAAVTTDSTNIYRVYPGLTAVANQTVNDVLPRTWRVKVTANNANSGTYSVGAMIIL